ncbi:MAG: outer membrane protein assembly factor BamD [Pedosphaera sp.]|nr:outer membrane protein assembly factor BamD [Pedosphaera sp.]
MNRRFIFLLLVFTGVALIPLRSPAPLVYTPGEGWFYESVGSESKWRRTKAKDQLEVAQAAFDKQDYSVAARAARYLIKTWPLSDYAPRAQYLVGRCYEARHQDEKAFEHYQKILEKYPKSENVKEVLARQYEIAGRYLKGQWFKLWGVIPLFSSMDRTADMYNKIVRNGPFSDVGPHAQLRIGAAREKQAHYNEAVKAYETAADRYHDRPVIAADALYRAGIAYQKQAKTAEYDQSMAGSAVASLTDFATLFPEDKRGPDAQKIMASLKVEQARGNFKIAEFYAKRKKWSGALVYYNEVVSAVPDQPAGAEARRRIETIKQRTQPAPK